MNLGKRNGVLAAGICVGMMVCGFSLMMAQAQKGTPAIPEPKCKITPVQAIKLAQSKVAGRALQANFEFDEGHWVYGVMIVQNKTIKEVEIDPMTGKIGGVETVTPEEEAKEVQSAMTAAIGGKAKAAPEKEEKEEKEEKGEKPR